MLVDGKIKKPVIIMIANQKGGVGKTTLALELCSSFGKKGYKVLGLDLDPQTSFSKLSGAKMEEDLSLKKVLDSKFGREITPINTQIQHLEEYDIVIGSEALADASSLYGGDDDAWLLADALETVKNYDFIILDSAPGRSRLLYMAYLASDYVLVPTAPDTEANAGIYKIAADLKQYTKPPRCLSHAKIIGIVMNRYKGNLNLHKNMLENLKRIAKDCNTYPFFTTINEAVAAQEARVVKQSVNSYVPKSKISTSFTSLVEEIIQRIGEFE